MKKKAVSGKRKYMHEDDVLSYELILVDVDCIETPCDQPSFRQVQHIYHFDDDVAFIDETDSDKLRKEKNYRDPNGNNKVRGASTQFFSGQNRSSKKQLVQRSDGKRTYVNSDSGSKSSHGKQKSNSQRVSNSNETKIHRKAPSWDVRKKDAEASTPVQDVVGTLKEKIPKSRDFKENTKKLRRNENTTKESKYGSGGMKPNHQFKITQNKKDINKGDVHMINKYPNDGRSRRKSESFHATAFELPPIGRKNEGSDEVNFIEYDVPSYTIHYAVWIPCTFTIFQAPVGIIEPTSLNVIELGFQPIQYAIEKGQVPLENKCIINNLDPIAINYIDFQRTLCAIEEISPLANEIVFSNLEVVTFFNTCEALILYKTSPTRFALQISKMSNHSVMSNIHQPIHVMKEKSESSLLNETNRSNSGAYIGEEGKDKSDVYLIRTPKKEDIHDSDEHLVSFGTVDEILPVQYALHKVLIANDSIMINVDTSVLEIQERNHSGAIQYAFQLETHALKQSVICNIHTGFVTSEMQLQQCNARQSNMYATTKLHDFVRFNINTSPVQCAFETRKHTSGQAVIVSIDTKATIVGHETLLQSRIAKQSNICSVSKVHDFIRFDLSTSPTHVTFQLGKHPSEYFNCLDAKAMTPAVLYTLKEPNVCTVNKVYNCSCEAKKCNACLKISPYMRIVKIDYIFTGGILKIDIIDFVERNLQTEPVFHSCICRESDAMLLKPIPQFHIEIPRCHVLPIKIQPTFYVAGNIPCRTTQHYSAPETPTFNVSPAIQVEIIDVVEVHRY